MRSPAAERALRRLVARLAAAAPADVELVLDALDPAQREEVRDLLDAYGQPVFDPQVQQIVEAPPPAPPPEPEPDLSHLEGLSPWLAERVASAEAGLAGYRMAPAAARALAESIRALPAEVAPTLAIAARPDRARRGPLSWIGRASWR